LRVPVGNQDLSTQITTFERAARRQLESEEYVSVHFFDPFSGGAAAELRSRLGFRLLYDAIRLPSLDSPYLGAGWASPKLVARARRLELFSMMNADRVLVTSPQAHAYVQALGVGEEHVDVLRPPVVLSPPSRVLVRPDDCLRLVHVGSDASYHDLKVAFEAFALVVNEQPNRFRLTLLGVQGAARQALETLADAVGAPVEFLPPVTHAELPEALAHFDVGLLTQADGPRNRDFGGGFSRLADYLGAGRPIVAADLPGLRQSLPSDAGCFYPCGDVASLAKHLRTLGQDSALRQRMSTAATAAAATFSETSVQAQLLALYQRLAPATGRAAAPLEITELRQGSTVDAAVEALNPDSPALPSGVVLEAEANDGWQIGRPGVTAGPHTQAPRVEVVALAEFFTGSLETAPPTEQMPAEPSPPPRPVATFGLRPAPPLVAPTEGASRFSPPIEPPLPAALPMAPAPPPLPQAVSSTTPLPQPHPSHGSRPTAPLAPEASADAVEIEASEVESLDDVVEEAAGVEEIAADVGPPPSALDPWFAQLAHGWGPSDGSLFDRHTPPTTMPGT
jgi:glycosyltransferase involved in cell wall biosynthesis